MGKRERTSVGILAQCGECDVCHGIVGTQWANNRSDSPTNALAQVAGTALEVEDRLLIKERHDYVYHLLEQRRHWSLFVVAPCTFISDDDGLVGGDGIIPSAFHVQEKEKRMVEQRGLTCI